MKKSSMKKKAVLLIVYGAGILLLLTTLFSFFKDYLNARKIDAEISLLQQEIYDLQESNLKVAELIQYFDSANYAEKKAREELGLIKPGESVVIFPKNLSESKIATDKTLKEKNSNLRMWFQYFYGRQK